MEKVYVVEIESAWDGGYEIDKIFRNREEAVDYAATVAVNRWAPSDEDDWQDSMEYSGKYISKFDYAKELADEGEWWIRVSEWEVN